MVEIVPVALPVTTNQQTGPAASSPASQGTEPKNNPSAELVETLQRELNWATKQIRLMQETQRGDNGKPNGKDHDTGIEKTLGERVKRLEEKQNRYAEKRRIDAVRDAAKAEGVPGERVEGVVRYLMPEVGAKLRYDEDRDLVEYIDLDPDQPQPVTKLVKEFLKTQAGMIYLPPPHTGSMPRGSSRPSSSPKISEMPVEDRLKLTSEERARRYREEAGIQ